MQSIPIRNNFTTQSVTPDGLHVAIIMDGNGRWAAQRGLPRVAGHRAGADAVQRIVERAPDIGIRTLTLYAFSSENWRRPKYEVQSILSLLASYLRKEAARLRQRDARLEVIGRRDRLPRLLLREIERAESVTVEGGRLHLRVAIDYSSRDAIARAAAAAATVAHNRRPSAVEMAHMLSHALSAECGEVDLLIRTGGEKRLSDFLLWESAYAELLFVDRMWPDFSVLDLEAALEEFSRRERRFGGVAPLTAASMGGGR
jgi:undecaprenyl diphosphate synthase